MNVTHPFGRAIVGDDENAALATLADDVEFRSPAVYKPYHGKEQVSQILRLVATVFENFRYTNEWRDGNTTILFFEANVGNRDLQGVDILEHGDDGLVERFHRDGAAAERPPGTRRGGGGQARRRGTAAIIHATRM